MQLKIYTTILLIGLFFQNAKSQTITYDSIDTCHIYYSLDKALKNPNQVYVLNLTKNKLTEFPNEILKFKNLNILYLNKNKLKSIPDSIGTLIHLQKLDLGKNKLETFPLGIVELVEMKKLILNQNYITGIPYAINKLKKLEYLDMWSNDLYQIPESISELPNLKEFDLRVIQFSNSEQERISKLLPNTLIHFSNSCNCGD